VNGQARGYFVKRTLIAENRDYWHIVKVSEKKEA
jgi:hypothetical protein